MDEPRVRDVPHGFEIREELMEMYERDLQRYRADLEEAKVKNAETIQFYEDLHGELARIKKMPPAMKPAA